MYIGFGLIMILAGVSITMHAFYVEGINDRSKEFSSLVADNDILKTLNQNAERRSVIADNELLGIHTAIGQAGMTYQYGQLKKIEPVKVYVRTLEERVTDLENNPAIKPIYKSDFKK